MSGGAAVQIRHLNILDPAAASEWDKLVHSHPDSTAFHESAWAQVIHHTYGHKPFHLCFTSADDEPVALIPIIEILSPITGRRAICLPFSDACGPLVFEQGAVAAVKECLGMLAQQRRWKYFEIRGNQLSDDWNDSSVTFYGHTLQLKRDTNAIFAGFSDGAKRGVRHAARNGLTVAISTDLGAVREFYNLQERTRRKHGVPPQPFAFFKNVHSMMIEKGLGFITLARKEDRAVAGVIFLRNQKRAIYKFAASDPEFAKTRGNHLVLWEGIRHLADNGCELLDFGRTSPDQKGLRQFKLSWGAEEEMILYTRFDAKSDRWSPAMRNGREGMQNRVFRNLPLSVNRLAGAMLYPHLD